MKFAILLATTLMAMTEVAALGKMNMQKVFGHGKAHEERIKSEIKAADGQFGDPQELFLDAKLDHNDGSSNATFKMRYLLDTTRYNITNGPILFYAGNEGGIWAFYNNSGYMTGNLSSDFGGMVVFAEHRYYGESKPFGNESFNSSANLKYLSVEQVMNDYVQLLEHLKLLNPELNGRATILFGGSYGGMLAAWMRMKFPN